MCAVTAGAQPAVTATISNVTRVESWSYFQPKIDPRAVPPPGSMPYGDPDYWFIGDRAELGVRVEGSRFDLSGTFNYVRLENLPTDAIGPGALGTGALYFAATGVRYSYQLYFGELSARIKSRERRMSFTIGRQPFSSGGEYAGATPALEALKRSRLHSRLIGNFEFSLYQRRFDGARFDLDRTRWHVTAAAFVPTQGGFEESANLSMPRIQLATASATRKASTSESQLFATLYRDRREEKALVDNSFSLDRPVNVTIASTGASFVRLAPVGSGELDTVAWGAAQFGDWYGREHRAASIAFEGGHRWTRAPLKPWLRAGALWSSGDANGADGRHGTFFQMMPTSRKYALSTVAAQMNVRDLFAQLAIEPPRFRARIEVHALRLASAADLWYAGSGATSSDGRYFGFAGRASGGHTGLGTVVEATVDVPIKRYWSVSGYAATMTAGDVVERWFTNKRLRFWFVENVVRF
ncbi:MAG TPA: alginate export family protein [Vicinamibacterales bacterium]